MVFATWYAFVPCFCFWAGIELLTFGVGDTVISAEFLGSSKEERLAMCQKLAAEAGQCAIDAANPETQRAYFDLQRQWEALAAQLDLG